MAGPKKQTFGRKVGWWVSYVAVLGVEVVLRLVPLWMCWLVGRVAGMVVYWVLPKYRKVALRNVGIAYGAGGTEGDGYACGKLARKALRTVGSNLVCSLKLPLMKLESIEARVREEGNKHLESCLEEGRGMVYGIPHMGNWEVLAQLHGVINKGRRAGALYQPLGNPLLNAHVRRRREGRGCVLFDRHDGFHGPVDFVRENGAIGVLVDQHAGDQGVWMPFFGRLASTSPLAGLIAARAGVPLVPCWVTDDGVGRWTIHYGEAIMPRRGKGAVEGMTMEMNGALERLIREAPRNWFWVHQRWKTPNPRFLLDRYRRGVMLPENIPPAHLKRFEILVRSPNWLGDACMAIPTVRAIKRGRMDARVTVLSPENLVSVWKKVEGVDSVVAKPKGAGVWKTGRLAKLGEGRKYDVAVLLPNSLRSALEAKAAGCERLVGYEGHHRKWLMGQIIPEADGCAPPMHHVRRYLKIAERAGADLTGEPRSPFLVVPRAEDDGVVRIGLCAGAEYGAAKRLPTEKYVEVMKQVSGRMPEVEWVLFGVKNEEALGREIESGAGVRCRNLIGKTTLDELMAALGACRLLLTNDTGTMHLAAAMGVPTVAVFGSTEPALTGPLGEMHTVVRNHVSCSPCFLRECPLDFRCMESVSPEQLAGAVMGSLSFKV